MIKCCATCRCFEPWADYKDSYIGWCDITRIVHKIDDLCDEWDEREPLPPS